MKYHCGVGESGRGRPDTASSAHTLDQSEYGFPSRESV
jgi:hypothetical protein